MPSVAFLGLKGGSGKTTCAVHVAGELGAARVLDLDPMAHAGTWATMAPKRGPCGPGFDVGRDIVGFSAPTSRAMKAELDRYRRSELVILDLPPQLAEAADVAVMTVDVVAIPCGPSPLDLAAAKEAVKLCRDARKVRAERGRPKVLLVPNRLIRGTVIARELPQVLANLGERVAPPIYERVALVEAIIAGQTIGEYAPESAARQEVRALADAIRELLARI